MANDLPGFSITVRAEAPAPAPPRIPRTYYPRCRAVLEVLLVDAPGRADDMHRIVVTPRRVDIERNNFLEADTFSAEFDYRDFPLDPRAVRSCRVQIFLGDAGAPDRDLTLDRSTLRFIGFLDEPATALGEDGETARFEGRDTSSLLLDCVWQGESLNIGRPLGNVIRGILQSVPGAEKMPFDPGPLHGKRLSELLGRTLYTPQAGDDVWTVISTLVGHYGFVPVMDLDRLTVRTPADVAQNKVALVYGSNVLRMKVARRLNERKVVQVELRAFDPMAGTTRTLLYPEKPPVVAKRVSSEGKVTPEYAPRFPFFVEGAFTDEELRTVAKSVYDQGALADTEGSVTTREMFDLRGVDIAAVGNGDQVLVKLQKQDRTALGGLSDQEAVNYLTEGPEPLPRDAAQAIVAGWRRSEDLGSVFYVSKARHTWDREQGYEVEIEFANYAGGQAR